MALLIPGCLLLAAFNFGLRGLDWKESLVRANLMVFALAAGATELLSAFGLLVYRSLTLFWTAAFLVILVFSFLVIKKKSFKFPSWFNHLKLRGFRHITWLEGFVWVSLILILLLTFLAAIYSPPNNYDSMTYHMARVANWIQNQSVRLYPTANLRQDSSMPLAEYMIMHLQILSQSDLYANLVQWSQFLILIVLVSKVAEKLGSSRRGQLMSLLFGATLPIAILESSSTQNDILTAVLCLSFGYFLLRLIENWTWLELVLSSLAFGLALLTKGTAYLFCAAIGIPLAVNGLWQARRNIRLLLMGKLVLLVVLGLAINTPYYLRNLNLSGKILGTETDRVTVEQLSLVGTYANLVRNVFVNLAVPLPDVNSSVSELLRRSLGSLADDPEITYPGSGFEVKYLINEDEAGNFLQVLLLLPLIWVVPGWIKRKEYDPVAWSLVVFLGLILFSSLLKWQPWGTRLQLPLFALAAPLFGKTVERLKSKSLIPFLLVMSLFSYSLPYLFLNSTRPLVPLFDKSSSLHTNKIKRFFSDRPDLYHTYSEVISPFFKDISIFHTERDKLYFTSQMSFYEDYVAISRQLLTLEDGQVGLLTGSNDWEYPIWALTDQHYGTRDLLFYHVGVDNQSREFGTIATNLPRYIVATLGANPTSILEMGYHLLLDRPALDLYIRSNE